VIDSHCHLADEGFVADLTDVVARATEAGVTSALCILSSDEPEEIDRVTRVREVWPAVRFAAAVHPHRSKPYGGREADAAELTRAAVGRSEAVAVGEMGLDYHYDFSPRAAQQAVFGAQIALAVELDRPVIIHTREATDDTHAVLRDAGQGRVRGVMHCFSGTVAEARRALDVGFFISLSGIVTFPRAGVLRDVARYVPADRLLIETDAPFLAPVPHRGKRNEPAWVAETLNVVAAERGVPAGDVGALVTANFLRFIHAGA
jgi:TatD DNase family protein